MQPSYVDVGHFGQLVICMIQLKQDVVVWISIIWLNG